jgi:hypothetical protein
MELTDPVKRILSRCECHRDPRTDGPDRPFRGEAIPKAGVFLTRSKAVRDNKQS